MEKTVHMEGVHVHANQQSGKGWEEWHETRQV